MLVLEDNDPYGFKSKKAKQAKKEVHIRAVPFPKYSPDLNPLDFHVWHAVEEKVIKKLKGPTSVKRFKELLRRTAKSLKEVTSEQPFLQSRPGPRRFMQRGVD